MTADLGRMGYGCMNLTWKPQHTPDEQAFEDIKIALDAGEPFLNTGTFYGQPDGTANLELLKRFFEKYPAYKEKAFISIKGFAQGSYESLSKDMKTIDEKLGLKASLYQCARVDKSRPIEETMQNLIKLKNEGHFQHIGLSECSAETIRRAATQHKIAAVEVEYSLWAFNIEQNGVLAACQDLGIVIIAYSPLGRGFLNGSVKSRDDLPEGDNRLHLDRFSEENFPHNLKIVEQIKTFASKKGYTPTQICLAWLMAQSTPNCPIIPIPGSTRPEGVRESLKALDCKLSKDEVEELRKIASSIDVKGGRYWPEHEHMLEG